MSEVIAHFERADGERKVLLRLHDSGLFSYTEELRVVEIEPETSPEPFEYHTPVYQSGLFDTIERALADARVRYPWLRPN